MQVLVVEDERQIADFISRGLEAEGYVVTCASDGLAGERLVQSEQPDIVILDVMLPGKDGFQVLESIREFDRRLPVIMLTALDAVEQKIEGLDRGATDYVTKPFSFAELSARVRAHLRTPKQSDSVTLELGALTLDFRKRQVTYGEQDVMLSAREFDLLAYLMRHPGQVLSKEQLLDRVWGYDHDPGTNVVEVYIGYLRRKMREVGGSLLIETVRSAGYKLVEDES